MEAHTNGSAALASDTFSYRAGNLHPDNFYLQPDHAAKSEHAFGDKQGTGCQSPHHDGVRGGK
jgi:hypothetical protein